MADEIVLNDTVFPSTVETLLSQGNRTFQMVAGDKLKIKNTGDDGTMYEETVPGGKAWKITINLNIKETDV